MCPGVDRSRRSTAIRAGYVGDAAAARALLSDPDPATRASALAALVRLGEVAAAELDQGLADPAPSVRRRALTLLVGLDHEAVGAVDLLAFLPDPDDTVTEVAAFVAGEVTGRGDPTAPGVVAALSAVATRHDDALCRESAVAALGAIGHPHGLAAVLAACDDRASVRRRAVLALAAFDGPEVEAALERLAGDRDLQVRQAAEELR